MSESVLLLSMEGGQLWKCTCWFPRFVLHARAWKYHCCMCCCVKPIYPGINQDPDDRWWWWWYIISVSGWTVRSMRFSHSRPWGAVRKPPMVEQRVIQHHVKSSRLCLARSSPPKSARTIMWERVWIIALNDVTSTQYWSHVISLPGQSGARTGLEIL